MSVAFHCKKKIRPGFPAFFFEKGERLLLKILKILNCVFVVSVALGAAGRVLPVFKKNRTIMINLFVLGLAGILTSALFKQTLLSSLSLVIAMHQLYTLELYQRYARMRKLERYVARKKKRIDALE